MSLGYSFFTDFKRRHSQAQGRYDQYLLFTVIAILSVGLLMVASASMSTAAEQYNNGFYYLVRQLAFISLGLITAIAIFFVDIESIAKHAKIFFLVGGLLAILVLVPGVAQTVNGSKRWINLGLIHVQISEISKLCFIIYLSCYLSKVKNQALGLANFIKPLILLAVMSLLLLAEPDFGAVVVIVLTSMGLFFLSGVRLKYFIVLFAIAVVAFSLLILIAPYRLQRITSFVNPWADQFGSGYQLTQALIAFGRGGISGVGLGNSLQKLFYLPEAHNDFLFAVLGEELGLLGILLVISLFAILVSRFFIIAHKSYVTEQFFAAYLCYGMGLWLVIQTMISMGVNLGMLPTKGLTLPFMSYGGSSMLVHFAALGMLFRIDYNLRRSG